MRKMVLFLMLAVVVILSPTWILGQESGELVSCNIIIFIDSVEILTGAGGDLEIIAQFGIRTGPDNSLIDTEFPHLTYKLSSSHPNAGIDWHFEFPSIISIRQFQVDEVIAVDFFTEATEWDHTLPDVNSTVSTLFSTCGSADSPRDNLGTHIQSLTVFEDNSEEADSSEIIFTFRVITFADGLRK